MWPAGTFWLGKNEGFFVSLMVYNVPNGVSKVEQDINGKCVLCFQ